MPTPEMHPVSSSNIAALGYDPDNQFAYVAFLHGKTYVYKNVPPQEFENLKTAPSIGAYFNRNFKNVYPYEMGS